MASKIVYRAVALVGIVIAGGLAWWYQSRPMTPLESGLAAGVAKPSGVPAGAVRPAGVEVAKVSKISLQDDAQSVGSLRSRQSVMLRPEVAGRVKALGFADGAQVRKGQLLVQLDNTLQQAELRQAQAQVSIAQANHQRNKELVAQGFVAQRVMDESMANLQVALAQVALAEAKLSRMALIAPFGGTLGLRNINVGDYVKDGADLVNLEDVSSMLVDFRVPERYQRKLKIGQAVELSLDAFPGRLFKARIEALDPLLDANGRSVAVRAVLPNTSGVSMQPGSKSEASTSRPTNPLRPGMFARVTAVFGINNGALVVPEESIVPQGGKQFVIKVMPPAAVPTATDLPADTQWVSLRQEVKLGVRRQGVVEVLDGLLEGQTIVVAGQQRLQRDGTPLRLVEMGKPVASGGSAIAPAVAASR